jgi:hypothetical protein
LRQEALLMRGTAQRNERADFQLVDGCQLLSPARNWYATAGNRRSELHEHTLGERLRSVLDARLEPSVSCYLYYEPGDFLGLHTDQVACPFTVLVLLDGNAGPVFLHPELRAMEPEKLLHHAVSHDGHPPGGIAVRLRDGPLVLAGSAIPHHRPPHLGSAEVALATFCFGADRTPA